MNTIYMRHNLNKEEKFIQALLGVIPGLLSWGVLIGIGVLAVRRPFTAAVVIIAFAFYMILRTLYIIIFLKRTYKRLVIDEQQADWTVRARGLDTVDEYLRNLYYGAAPEHNSPEDYSLLLHKDEIKELRAVKNMPVPYQQIYHCVIIPLVEEECYIINDMMESLRLSSFPPQRIAVFFSVSENQAASFHENLKQLEEHFHGVFYALRVVKTSDKPAGRLSVKALAINAGLQAASVFFEQNNISADCVIVSYFDSPCVLNPEHFSCLTYFYMVNPYRTKVTFSPIAVYSDELRRESTAVQAFEIATSSLELAEAGAVRSPSRFLGNSMSLQLFNEVGYLPCDIISYSQSFSREVFARNSNVCKIAPFYVRFPADIKMVRQEPKTTDIIRRRRLLSTWRVEEFVYFMRRHYRNKEISFMQKLKYLMRTLEASTFEATWPFLLSFLACLPLAFLGREFSHPVFYYSVGRVFTITLIVSFLGFVVNLHLCTVLAMRPKEKPSILGDLTSFLPWLIMSVMGFFSAAAIMLRVQTALLFGRYEKKLD